MNKPLKQTATAPRDEIKQIKPLICSHYPIWEKQPTETDYWHQMFIGCFLKLPLGFRDILNSWNEFRNRFGEGSTTYIPAPQYWINAHKSFLWEYRAKEYEKAVNYDDLQYYYHRRRHIQDMQITVIERSLEKSLQLLQFPVAEKTVQEYYPDGREKITIVKPARWKGSDISALTQSALNNLKTIDNIYADEVAIERLQQRGYIVLDPTQAQETTIVEPKQLKSGNRIIDGESRDLIDF